MIGRRTQARPEREQHQVQDPPEFTGRWSELSGSARERILAASRSALRTASSGSVPHFPRGPRKTRSLPSSESWTCPCLLFALSDALVLPRAVPGVYSDKSGADAPPNIRLWGGPQAQLQAWHVDSRHYLCY